MFIETLSQSFRKARAVNQTSNGYVSKVPTNTTPQGDAGTATGSSVIDLAYAVQTGPLTVCQNNVLIVPFGTGANDNTFSLRVIGWRVLGTDPGSWLWVPINLGEFACTMSAVTGVAGTPEGTTAFFCDTITMTVGAAGQTNEIVSPANDTIGFLVADLFGFQKLELSFTTGGSATDCNALLALL